MTEVNATQKQQLEADELKSLADEFLASKGIATKPKGVKKTDVMGPGMSLLIGIPPIRENKSQVCYVAFEFVPQASRNRHPIRG
jgi:hypothetical protein